MEIYDLCIIGGGINGAGCARDAAGRGLSVFLCEQNDLASATSSASTKLIHGGLRYLEYYKFRLVREALHEREVLLSLAPHIISPLRFILPHHRALRPAWLLRLGLLLYDNLGGRKILPRSIQIDLEKSVEGQPLRANYQTGFEYSDCWVLDSRLVILNAMDAAQRGAKISPRSQFTRAKRRDGIWDIYYNQNGEEKNIRAKGLINASGPWLEQTLGNIPHSKDSSKVRMVKGSHIIVPKLFDHPKAYIFQGEDGRITFAIPYEEKFTLIGTTDLDFTDDPSTVQISQEEREYLCKAANLYFSCEITDKDIIHTYSGVRPLFDDGKDAAQAATRDYVIQYEDDDGNAPLLSIYGGKITTYRKLAESVLDHFQSTFPQMGASWSANSPLPGGDFPWDGRKNLEEKLLSLHTFLSPNLVRRLIATYGTKSLKLCERLRSQCDMGHHFGHDLYQFEVEYLQQNEWAVTAEDILERRSKLGLLFSNHERTQLAHWLTTNPH